MRWFDYDMAGSIDRLWILYDIINIGHVAKLLTTILLSLVSLKHQNYIQLNNNNYEKYWYYLCPSGQNTYLLSVFQQQKKKEYEDR